MEEKLTSLLVNILTEIPKEETSKVLEKYYQLFDEKKYMGSKFELIYHDIQENYNLSLQSLRYCYSCEQEKKTYKGLIYALISESDNKKRIKLIPLIIYLDNNRILYDYLYRIDYFDNFIESIRDFFIETVKGSGIKVSNIEQLPSHHQEKEWFKQYNEGIKTINFQQIYSFVEGFERGGGFEFDIYTDFLIFITYKYFFDDLVEIANNKHDMFEIIYFLNILTLEESLILGKTSTNYLLKFEAIRKAVYFKSNSFVLLENEKELVGDIVIQLAKEENIWKQFLNYFFEYPLRSKQLFYSMPQVIDKLDIKNIDLMLETLNIDKYASEDSKEALNGLFLSIEDYEIKKYCISNIFKKWVIYINKHNEYFRGLILTDVIDLSIANVRDFLDKNKAISEIEKIFYELDEIDNKWFKDSMEYQNYFYKQMTLLFVYSWIIQKYDLSDLKERIKYFCMNSFILKKERISEDKKTTLKIFNEYIFEVKNNER